MRILAGRPLAMACLVAMGVAVISYFLPFAAKLIILSSLMLLIIIASFFRWFRSKHATSTSFSLILILALAMLTVLPSIFHFDFAFRIPHDVIDTDQTCSVECVILEERGAGSGYSYYTVNIKTINGEKVNCRAALECTYTATFHVGDVICSDVQIQSLDTFYHREEKHYAVANGIRAGLVSEDISTAHILETDQLPLRQLFSKWSAHLSARLFSLTGKQNGALATALFLGDRSQLDEHVTTCFRRTGVSHLLALSGMHVTLLLGLVAALTVHIRVPKKGRIVFLTILALAYLALVGFRISAIRATGMLLLFYLAELVGKRHDPLTTLCTIGFGMLVVSPTTVADGGFWMSFSSVFGLVTVLPKYNEWLISKVDSRKVRTVMQAIAASFVAVISVSFFTWLFCGEIAPIGILMTVILSPVLSMILSLMIPVLLLDMIPFLSATPLALLLSALLTFMREFTSQVASLPQVSFVLNAPFTGILLAVMSITLLILLIVPLRKKYWLIIPPLITTFALIFSNQLWTHTVYDDQLQAAYVVRSSGSALIVSDEEGTAVIDTSSGSFSMMRDIERAILSQGENEIEDLILTHYHRAFIYSTERFAKRMMIRRIWVPIPQTDEEYEHLCAMYDRLSPLGTQLRMYREGEQLPLFGNAVFHSVDISYLSRSKQPITTYMIQTPNNIVTYTSPSIQESEYYSTFRWICQRTDFLILGKHGPTIKQPLDLPLNEIAPKMILTDAMGIISYLDLSSQSKIYEIPMITDITCYRFSISK